MKPDQRTEREKTLLKIKLGCDLSEFDKLILKIHKYNYQDRIKLALQLYKIRFEYNFQIFIGKGRESVILNFYFPYHKPSEKLCIDVNEWEPSDKEKLNIERRELLLNSRGFKTIRFTNNEVQEDLHLVLCIIRKELGLLW